jgi:Flp pilus assembly protein TadG
MPRTLIRNEQGAAAVEFALLAPVLISLTLALADFGLALRERVQLVGAANAGIHYAARNPDNTGGVGAAVTAATAIPSARLSVSTTTSCECADGSAAACVGGTCPAGGVRTYVTVSVSETFPLLFDYPGLGASLSLSARAVQRIE